MYFLFSFWSFISTEKKRNQAVSMFQTNSSDTISTRLPPIDTANKDKETQIYFHAGLRLFEKPKARNTFPKERKLHPSPLGSVAINYPHLTFQKIVIEIFSYKQTHNERNRVEWYYENKGKRRGGQNKDIRARAPTPEVQPPATEMPKESRSAGATFRLTQ